MKGANLHAGIGSLEFNLDVIGETLIERLEREKLNDKNNSIPLNEYN